MCHSMCHTLVPISSPLKRFSIPCDASLPLNDCALLFDRNELHSHLNQNSTMRLPFNSSSATRALVLLCLVSSSVSRAQSAAPGPWDEHAKRDFVEVVAQADGGQELTRSLFGTRAAHVLGLDGVSIRLCANGHLSSLYRLALEGLDMNRRTVLMPPEMVEMAVVQGHGMVLNSIELSL